MSQWQFIRKYIFNLTFWGININLTRRLYTPDSCQNSGALSLVSKMNLDLDSHISPWFHLYQFTLTSRSRSDILPKGLDLLNPLFNDIFRFHRGHTRYVPLNRYQARRQNCPKILIGDWAKRNWTVPNEGDDYWSQIITSICPLCYEKKCAKNSREFPLAVSVILNQNYVVGCLDSADTEEEALSLIHSIIEVYKKSGFQIRNWISNSWEVLKNWNSFL